MHDFNFNEFKIVYFLMELILNDVLFCSTLPSVIDKLDEVENIDLVCCLNVLDRCADPHQILTDIHRALSPDGRAVIALVLPYSHYVETSKSNLM